MATDLILTTAQAQAVYSAMCALNNLGRVGGSVIIPKEPDQRDEPRVTWNFLGVTVYQDLTFHKEFYADQAAFAAAYGLAGMPDLPGLVETATDALRLIGKLDPAHPNAVAVHQRLGMALKVAA